MWSGAVLPRNATYHRKDVGISKSRFGAQLEGLKFIGDVGPFRNVSINGVLRLSYDAVYDLNEDDFNRAGGAATVNSVAGPAPVVPVNGLGIGPAGGANVGVLGSQQCPWWRHS